MSAWVNGRAQSRIDVRDRGLQYGDGLFETMRVHDHGVRLLDYHLERLVAGCRRLRIEAPEDARLRREIERGAALRAEAVLKLIVTRGVGARGYRPSGAERSTRVLTLHPLPPRPPGRAAAGVRVRLCRTPLAIDPVLAGLKSLNRLDSVMARSEWRDLRIWEGLMCDAEDRIVCGTSSNVFLRRGSILMTPRLDRCGVAGVMRRWVLEVAPRLGLRPREIVVRRADLRRAEEIFLTNAVAGVVAVARVEEGARCIVPASTESAQRLRARLELL